MKKFFLALYDVRIIAGIYYCGGRRTSTFS